MEPQRIQEHACIYRTPYAQCSICCLRSYLEICWTHGISALGPASSLFHPLPSFYLQESLDSVFPIDTISLYNSFIVLSCSASRVCFALLWPPYSLGYFRKNIVESNMFWWSSCYAHIEVCEAGSLWNDPGHHEQQPQLECL